jgi:hypothetical protein
MDMHSSVTFTNLYRRHFDTDDDDNDDDDDDGSRFL